MNCPFDTKKSERLQNGGHHTRYFLRMMPNHHYLQLPWIAAENVLILMRIWWTSLFLRHPDSLFSGNWFTNVVRAYVCYSGCHKSRIINSISEVISQNRKLKYVNKQSSDHILQLRGFISQGKFGKNSKNRS